MPRPNKVTSSRSTPRPSTRSQQQSPSINKPSLLITLKNPSNAAPSSRGEASDNDNDSVCSSSKSSDVLLARSSAKNKPKDDPDVVKVPWRHPDELDYLRPYDWSEDRIISQLRSMVFTVPPPVFGKQPFIEITLYEGGDFDKPRPVKVPRGYRVPLMFVAKFQWASLKLVLTSAQREKEWSDYKFDILHLSRLCQRFFSGASTACDIAVVDVPPVKTRAPGFQLSPGAMTRKWRCPTFDRALARYNKNWLISREEFLRDFYIEFDDEEYVKDVLKIDWSRWALKGHKGFKLSQDELRYGIDGRMITRGLKREDDGKWVWLDDYVIKQEEVAVAVESVTQQVTVMDSSADQPVTPKDSEQESPIVPLPPPQNGQSSSHTNMEASARSTPVPTSVVGQPAEEVVSTPRRTPVLESSDQTPSNQESTNDVASEPSLEQNVSHSPLSSISTSPSPSVPPLDVVETHSNGVVPPSSNPATPAPRSGSVGARSSSRLSSKHSSPPLPAPLTITIPPAEVSYPSFPDPQEPGVVGSPVSSEVTQPPKSPSAISSPERRPSSLGPASEAEVSQLTQLGTSDYGRDLTPEKDSNESKANVEASPISEGRFSPTSIDSTPTPSPMIIPQQLAGSGRPTPIPNTVSGNSPVSLPQTTYPDVKPLIPNTIPLHPTPYWLPRPQSPTNSDTPTVQANGRSRSSPQPNSPVFMSPLLPPTSRSLSLDEIPGLGELSSRPPLTLTTPLVVPPKTRTDTEDSSWIVSDQEKERVKQEVDSPIINPSRSPVGFSEAVEAGATNVANLAPPLKNTTRHHPQASLNTEGTQPAPENFPSIPSHPSTPRSLTQNPIHARSSDYDEDSDMDFGTPVTSPLIIVPESKVDVIGALPPLISPCPVRTVGSKHKIISPRAETPRGTTPTTVTLVATAPQTVTQQPTTPPPRTLQLVAPKTTLQAPPSEEAAVEELARGSGSPMRVDGTLLREENNRKEVHPSTVPTSSITSSQPIPPVQSLVTSPKLVPTTPQHHSSPPLTLLPALKIPSALVSPSIILSPSHTSTRAPKNHTPTAPVPAAVLPDPLPLSSSPPAQNYARSEGPYPPPLNLGSDTALGVGVHQGENGKDQTPNIQPLTPTQPQATFVDTAMAQLPPTPSHCRNFGNDAGPPQASQQSNQQTRASTSRIQPQIPQSASATHKRRREGDESDEDEGEVTFKSRKRSEGLSVREGGIVVRKVVSMVRDTLTGLNDLLELAAEQELIPSERFRGRSNARALPFREESPLFTPTSPSPVAQTPVRAQVHREARDIMRLDEELRLMKAEVAQLKEQKARETPVEPDPVHMMRSELEVLREQVRTLKETKAPRSHHSEMQGMRDEILSLKNEIYTFQRDSRPTSVIPSIPSTPSIRVPLNDQRIVQAIHPLAHLLVAGPDLVPPTPKTPPTTTPQSQAGNEMYYRMQSGGSTDGVGSRGQPEMPPPTPHSPIKFDDISLPVKSKRKARMIFSKS